MQLLTSIFTLALLSLSLTVSADAKMTQQQFIDDAFDSDPIKLKKLWLTGNKKQVVAEILGHPYHQLRVSYWTSQSQPDQTVWVLHEIGKEKYIDVGIVINQQKIQKLRILEFRESRGWEVKLPFFTKQFDQNALSSDYKLTEKVDSITGATLSYRAVTKLARMALFLDQQLKKH